MATFVVEDGTGTDATANSYASVDAFRDYHKDRGTDISSLGTTDIQKLLVQATTFVDLRWGSRFGGSRLLAGQPLIFPRTGLYDWDGNEVEEIPTRLVNATCEYALFANTESLWVTPTVDASGMNRSRVKVGPIETEFMSGTSPSEFRSIPAGDRWLQEYVTKPDGSTYRA